METTQPWGSPRFLHHTSELRSGSAECRMPHWWLRLWSELRVGLGLGYNGLLMVFMWCIAKKSIVKKVLVLVLAILFAKVFVSVMAILSTSIVNNPVWNSNTALAIVVCNLAWLMSIFCRRRDDKIKRHNLLGNVCKWHDVQCAQ